MNNWTEDAVFYHIYPLGLTGAPWQNDFVSAPVHRLDGLLPWLDYLREMGFTALYLGPVFESGTHGYDTADYYHVDRRLGDRQTLARLVEAAHQRGIRVVLDGVFNHVGRNFWAFRDLQRRGAESPYRDWFANLRFGMPNRSGDPFSYDTWGGHESLVKLNLHHPAARDHLLQAACHWIDDYAIDGLRLDAADSIDIGFLEQLSETCRSRKPDFWLMGEVVHGDYRRWANPRALDATTNYESYKALYSSHNDHNYFELAYALERQSGPNGLYHDLRLYTFADNHDVDRVASRLRSHNHLTPLYTILFSMPGIPSVYYGSEFGIQGHKDGSDALLRPALDLNGLRAAPPVQELPGMIRELIRLRRSLPALQNGNISMLHVSSEQLAFVRDNGEQQVVVAANASDQPAEINLPMEKVRAERLEDMLDPGTCFERTGAWARIPLPPNSARILIHK